MAKVICPMAKAICPMATESYLGLNFFSMLLKVIILSYEFSLNIFWFFKFSFAVFLIETIGCIDYMTLIWGPYGVPPRVFTIVILSCLPSLCVWACASDKQVTISFELDACYRLFSRVCWTTYVRMF